jgi:hypothetical protein
VVSGVEPNALKAFAAVSVSAEPKKRASVDVSRRFGPGPVANARAGRLAIA